jgi:hypothetical protein
VGVRFPLLRRKINIGLWRKSIAGVFETPESGAVPGSLTCTVYLGGERFVVQQRQRLSRETIGNLKRSTSPTLSTQHSMALWSSRNGRLVEALETRVRIVQEPQAKSNMQNSESRQRYLVTVLEAVS